MYWEMAKPSLPVWCRHCLRTYLGMWPATQANSAFYPPGSDRPVNEDQLRLETKRQVWFISVSWCTRGVQVKLWDSLRTLSIPERLRGVFTTRCYTNSRLSLPWWGRTTGTPYGFIGGFLLVTMGSNKTFCKGWSFRPLVMLKSVQCYGLTCIRQFLDPCITHGKPYDVCAKK